MTQIFLFALIGRLLVFLFQKFPKDKLPFIGKLFQNGKFLEQLFACDLCLGFWVYSGLAFIINVNVAEEWFYIPVFSEFLTGAVISFIMHLISAGWEARYQNIVIE